MADEEGECERPVLGADGEAGVQMNTTLALHVASHI